MKCRFDFVTNSSSSSFVCIRFKSKRLKELLTKYDVQYWKSNSKWDVYYKDKDVSCTAVIQNSVKGALDWFMEDLLPLMNSDNEFIEEYRSDKQPYIDDITELYYQIDDTNRDEFEGTPEKHDIYEYKKGVISERTIKKCFENLKNDFFISSYRPVKSEQYLGLLHLQQATGESEIVLVREPDNVDNPNAIFVEEVPHKYLGYFWDGINENLAPIFDSGQYLYRAKFDTETWGIYIEFAKSNTKEKGWKRIETGSPQITDEEINSVRESFNQWLNDLKTKYEGKKKPSSIDTLIKQGGIRKNIILEWAKVLYREDLAVVLSNEGLLNTKTSTGIDLVKWDKGDESDDEYYERMRNSIEERVSHVSAIEFEGNTFVNFSGRYGGWARTDPRNPIILTIENAGGIIKNAVTRKTDYVIIDTANKPKDPSLCKLFVQKWSTVLKSLDKGNKLLVITLKNFESITGLDEELAKAACWELYRPNGNYIYYATIDK